MLIAFPADECRDNKNDVENESDLTGCLFAIKIVPGLLPGKEN